MMSLMTTEERWATVEAAVAALNATGSPSTRTHIHKLLYLAQEFGVMPVPFTFVLHHHGPYSFDLDGEIISMEAFNRLRVAWDRAGYGGRYTVDHQEVPPALRRLAEWLGGKTTRQLEALATSQFVEKQGVNDVIGRVGQIKPHLGKDEILSAIAELNEKRSTLATPSPAA